LRKVLCRSVTGAKTWGYGFEDGETFSDILISKVKRQSWNPKTGKSVQTRLAKAFKKES